MAGSRCVPGPGRGEPARSAPCRPRTARPSAAPRVRSMPRQLAHLVRAGGDDQVDRRGELRARSRAAAAGWCPRLPWCRRLTVPSAWNVCTTGMAVPRAASSAASPDIQKCAWTTSGRPRAAQSPRHPATERGHERVEVVLGHRAGRTGGDVDHGGARPERHPLGQVRTVPAGVDLDLVAPAPERPGERGDVDVLAARVDAAEGGQRAGVLGHHGDLSSGHPFQEPVPVVEEPLEPVARRARAAAAARPRSRASAGSSSHRAGGRAERVDGRT